VGVVSSVVVTSVATGVATSVGTSTATTVGVGLQGQATAGVTGAGSSGGSGGNMMGTISHIQFMNIVAHGEMGTPEATVALGTGLGWINLQFDNPFTRWKPKA
jgi:hypothetical protein